VDRRPSIAPIGGLTGYLSEMARAGRRSTAATDAGGAEAGGAEAGGTVLRKRFALSHMF